MAEKVLRKVLEVKPEDVLGVMVKYVEKGYSVDIDARRVYSNVVLSILNNRETIYYVSLYK